jgi:peptidoglycan-associated lipoprotein
MRNVVLLAVLATAVACGSKQKTSVTAPVIRPAPGGEAARTPDSAATATQEKPASDDGVVRRFGPIYFAYDQDVIDRRGGDILAEVAAFLEKNAGATAVLEGHADERGTPEYNIALGDRRAQSSRRYLQRLGVTDARLQAVSYGEERPAAEGETEAAWSQNRRVEIVVKGR